MSIYGFVVALFAGLVTAGPILSAPTIYNQTIPQDLKVLCVGDSITVGVGDVANHSGIPDGTQNGYRLPLYNKLLTAGVQPQFIGTQVSGTGNPQPHHEGYGSNTIYMILDHLNQTNILSQQPDVVLIHAGTNDNDLPQYPSSDNTTLYAYAPTRLGQLIDFVLCANPFAVLLVAELVHNNYNPNQTAAFNAVIPGVVAKRYDMGLKVKVVNMTMIAGKFLGDLLHPTGDGYAVMAENWYNAMTELPASWWSKKLLDG